MKQLAARTIAHMLFGFALLAAGFAVAEDQPLSRVEAREPDRQEWRNRIDDARRRVDQLRREGRLSPPVQSSARQRDEDRSRRALEDSSLQVGDIVSTNRGLFRFNGRSKESSETGHFSPVGPESIGAVAR